MGSPDSVEGRFDREGPQHLVHVQGFYMGRYLAENKNTAEPEYWGYRKYNQPRQPVVGVSWKEAQQYAR
jgi:formylglycine-generating enzyme required for sulfatase activity